MLDFDLANLYEVETRVLKQSVKRNLNRFPSDFMLELTKEEMAEILMSQIVTSIAGGTRKFSSILPSALSQSKAWPCYLLY